MTLLERVAAVLQGSGMAHALIGAVRITDERTCRGCGMEMPLPPRVGALERRWRSVTPA